MLYLAIHLWAIWILKSSFFPLKKIPPMYSHFSPIFKMSEKEQRGLPSVLAHGVKHHEQAWCKRLPCQKGKGFMEKLNRACADTKREKWGRRIPVEGKLWKWIGWGEVWARYLSWNLRAGGWKGTWKGNLAAAMIKLLWGCSCVGSVLSLSQLGPAFAFSWAWLLEDVLPAAASKQTVWGQRMFPLLTLLFTGNKVIPTEHTDVFQHCKKRPRQPQIGRQATNGCG